VSGSTGLILVVRTCDRLALVTVTRSGSDARSIERWPGGFYGIVKARDFLAIPKPWLRKPTIVSIWVIPQLELRQKKLANSYTYMVNASGFLV
jgi:hypothetical protein